MLNNIKNSSFIFLFFFLMLTLPTAFQFFRGILLILIVLFSLRIVISQKLSYGRGIVFLGLLNIFTSIFFIILGIFSSAPGAIRVSTVYVLWPVLYLYFIGFSTSVHNIQKLMKVILYGSLVSSILVLLFIVNFFFQLPLISLISDSQNFNANFLYSGFFELHSMNLTTVLYGFAFSVTCLLLPKNNNLFSSNSNKLLLILTFVLSFFLIIVSGRRAFWVVCLISPIVVVVLCKLINIKVKITKYIMPFIYILVLTFGIVEILSLDIVLFEKEFSSIFEFQSDSNSIRKEQFLALINEWKESPIFGKGHGSGAKGSIRDVNQPWAYELSYIALLFHTGLVGFLIYSFSVFWIFIKGISLMRMNKNRAVELLAPQLVALFCFLIINASNPYLEKFDYLWTIFLPIATINSLLLKSRY